MAPKRQALAIPSGRARSPLAQCTTISGMTIIEIRPSQKFKCAWASYEAPGVEPAFIGPRAKELALGYARSRFGGRAGEIRVYDNVGAAVEENVPDRRTRAAVACRLRTPTAVALCKTKNILLTQDQSVNLGHSSPGNCLFKLTSVRLQEARNNNHWRQSRADLRRETSS